jgi:beta-glucosidase
MPCRWITRESEQETMKEKASNLFQTYENPNGIKVSTVSRKILKEGELSFKDIDGTGEIDAVNDWRVPANQRAEAYVKLLSIQEKIAQLFIADWRMAKYPGKGPTAAMAPKVPMPDETGILDEAEFRGRTIFGDQYQPGTTTLLKEWFNRHIIFRANPTPEDMTDWINQLNATAEECERYLPVDIVSNSRNENGEVVFGMNDASGVFANWPGTLGIAAAVKGTDLSVIDDFGNCVKREWNACGLRKGYMYMADCVTDPRWQRTFGTFGEDPKLISDIFTHLIPSIQGSANGVTKDGVAVTTKHFPGGGARENGFDPHYAEGQWNVYATKDSLKNYHLPAFEAAIKANTSSIMPYYSKPAAQKSSEQTDPKGNVIDLKPYGFSFNRWFMQDLLRDELGFKGYINSDTGILHNMAWGVEMLDVPERIGYAINHAGVDLVGGLFDNEAGMEAYLRSTNGYYDEHPVPEGFTKDELVLTEEAIDRAVVRTLTEQFELGTFDDSYRSPKAAAEAVSVKSDWDNAQKIHRESVVLLKNDNVLPLTKDKTAGKTFYAECFNKNAEAADKATAALKEMLSGRGVTLTDHADAADYAILMITPSSGAYFNATPGYLELDICDGKAVCNVAKDGRPEKETHLETTVANASKLKDIAAQVHGHGGDVITNLNISLAWQPGNAESISDAMTCGFDTYPSATLDVIFGDFAPVGKLPITLPKNDAVLHVNDDGVCVSPNDVPGFDKDQYMPDSMKDENGKAYAYRDANGNYYELGFGLKY